jgi:hypothetical protein
MDTLKLLASRLGKPVSFFLEEDALASPNRDAMEEARARFDSQDYAGAAEALETYKAPDPVYDRERALLLALSLLELAEQAIAVGRYPYALELLDRADTGSVYCREALFRRRLLLLAKIPGQTVSHLLPSLDEELLIRAEEALADGSKARAKALLEAVQEQKAPIWNLLRGSLELEERNFRDAARYLHLAENQYPRETAPLLERCYRELQDYKRAYEYACRQK